MSLHPFRVAGMTARLLLVAFAWNCRQQHVQQDPKIPRVINFGQDGACTGCVAHDRSGRPAPSHSGVDGLDGGRVHPQATTAAHHSTAAHRESRFSGATSQSGRADREASSPLSAVRCCSQSVCLRLMNTLSNWYQLLSTEQCEACIVGDTCLSCHLRKMSKLFTLQQCVSVLG